MRIFIVVVSVAALALAIFLAALGPGVRFGLWDYGTALGLTRQIALPLLIAAALAGIAFLASLWQARGLVPLTLVAAIAAGAAGYVPLKMKSMVEGNPFIHDITTDFESPPEIVAAANMPRKNPAPYAGAEKVVRSEMTVTEAQMKAFPDIVPLLADEDVDAAVEKARAVIQDMHMEMLAEGPVSDASGSGWRIEAVATSLWYGFKDDFIVRIDPREEGGVRIDVRSQSRVGLSDLGANAKRVKEFLSRMDAAL